MNNNRLHMIHEDFNTTVWKFKDQNSFRLWLKDNNIEDRHDLADEVFCLAHTLLIEDGTNWDEYGIVALGTDEGHQSYEIVTDENGKKVLSTDQAFWGENFEKLLDNINRQLDAESLSSVQDVLNSYNNGNFTQAKQQIAEILESGRNIINELLNEDTTRNEAEFVLCQVAFYLADRPSLEARQAFLNISRY